MNALLRPYNVRVLECATVDTDLRCIVSLTPTETISACASKLKGRVSKWLREQLQLIAPESLLSKGYFACTTGKTKTSVVERYLSVQAEHHGYARRIHPPIFVGDYRLTETDENRISAKHALVIAKFHLVFSTSERRGIIGSRQGRRIADEWLKVQRTVRFALIKVSFVPDHVHVALRSHPAISPAEIAAALMNSAQEVLTRELVEARVNRLWMNSAYIGAYGDLAHPQMRRFIENWRRRRD